MSEDIREVHGMACKTVAGKDAHVVLQERNGAIFLKGEFDDKLLMPAQARYLARKLDRLAKRVEERATHD
jgi:hypothetical protein